MENNQYFYHETIMRLLTVNFQENQCREKKELIEAMKTLEKIWKKPSISKETLERFFDVAENHFNSLSTEEKFDRCGYFI